jgi:hypothetical protein
MFRRRLRCPGQRARVMQRLLSSFNVLHPIFSSDLHVSNRFNVHHFSLAGPPYASSILWLDSPVTMSYQAKMILPAIRGRTSFRSSFHVSIRKYQLLTCSFDSLVSLSPLITLKYSLINTVLFDRASFPLGTVATMEANACPSHLALTHMCSCDIQTVKSPL